MKGFRKKSAKIKGKNYQTGDWKKHKERSKQRKKKDFSDLLLSPRGAYEADESFDFEILQQRFSYSADFSSKVEKEAAKAWTDYQKDLEYYEKKKSFPKSWLDREDLTQLTIFTIDGVTAKDFDDAISIEKIKDGYRLGVHIADVSFFVQRPSLLDEAAFQRATSVYLVDKVIPMLPEQLSNDICSLVADSPRLTVSVFLDYNQKGLFKKYHFCNSVIKSSRRCTYDEVQDFFDGKISLPKKIENSLVEMRILKNFLSEKRFNEGSIGFEEDEQVWDFAKEDNDFLSTKKRKFSEEMIEEFMLEANKAASKKIAQSGKGIFRVHESPDEEKIFQFNQLIRKMKRQLPKMGSENPLQKKGPNKYHLFLQNIKNQSEKLLFSKLLLTSMKQAHYHDKDSGHYGLGFPNYTHFTSPIRRYPDLLVHRILKEQLRLAMLGKKNVSFSDGVLQGYAYLLKEMARHCSDMERKAVKAEREYSKLKSIRYMKNLLEKKKDLEWKSFITGITFRGNVFVRLEELGIEGMIKCESFPEMLYYDESRMALCNHKKQVVLTVGSELFVKLLRASVGDFFVEFVPSKWN